MNNHNDIPFWRKGTEKPQQTGYILGLMPSSLRPVLGYYKADDDWFFSEDSTLSTLQWNELGFSCYLFVDELTKTIRP